MNLHSVFDVARNNCRRAKKNAWFFEDVLIMISRHDLVFKPDVSMYLLSLQVLPDVQFFLNITDKIKSLCKLISTSMYRCVVISTHTGGKLVFFLEVIGGHPAFPGSPAV